MCDGCLRDRSSDDHELLPVQAFRFNPYAAVAGSVWPIGSFRDYPFQAKLAGMLAKARPFAYDVFAVAQARDFQTTVQTTRTPRSAASRSTISSGVVSGFSRSTPRMNASWASSTETLGLPC